MTLVMPPKSLDDAGRCCGRKPLVYKRPHRLFCPRCDAEYNHETGLQQQNWCYLPASEGDGFVFRHEHMQRAYIAAHPACAPKEG